MRIFFLPTLVFLLGISVSFKSRDEAVQPKKGQTLFPDSTPSLHKSPSDSVLEVRKSLPHYRRHLNPGEVAQEVHQEFLKEQKESSPPSPQQPLPSP